MAKNQKKKKIRALRIFPHTCRGLGVGGLGGISKWRNAEIRLVTEWRMTAECSIYSSHFQAPVARRIIRPHRHGLTPLERFSRREEQIKRCEDRLVYAGSHKGCRDAREMLRALRPSILLKELSVDPAPAWHLLRPGSTFTSHSTCCLRKEDKFLLLFY